MYKYLIVLSDDGIGTIVGITLDKPIHELYREDGIGRTYIEHKGQLLDFYLHSIIELKDVETLFE